MKWQVKNKINAACAGDSKQHWVFRCIPHSRKSQLVATTNNKPTCAKYPLNDKSSGDTGLYVNEFPKLLACLIGSARPEASAFFDGLLLVVRDPPGLLGLAFCALLETLAIIGLSAA